MTSRALDRESAAKPHQAGRRESVRPATAMTFSSSKTSLPYARSEIERRLRSCSASSFAPPTRPTVKTGDIDQRWECCSRS